MTDKPAAEAATGGTPDAADPSMEEILASIRRILNEDDTPATDSAEAAATGDDVLVLDPSMLVSPAEDRAGAEFVVEPKAKAAEMFHPPAQTSEDDLSVPMHDIPSHAQQADPTEPSTPTDMLAPETAAATASSISSLVRTLSASRATQVYSGGPTLEDLVRAELRPLLKHWLDANLPPVVERLVRAEIERVVGRAVP